MSAAPEITANQNEGIPLMEQICEDLYFKISLERGDIQFANNAVILHTREGFEDWAELESRRQLWRLWLVQPEIREANPYILQWRNGVHPKGTKLRVTLN